MHRVLLSAAALLCAALPATAQNTPKKLTVKPAAEPKPALKYVLLPEVRDVQPGNAALAYMRAMNPVSYANFARIKHEDWEASSDWLEGPLAKMPRVKAASMIPTEGLRAVDEAARQEFCDWELLARIRKAGVGTLVPEVQVMRQVIHLLTLRGRLEMLNGKTANQLAEAFADRLKREAGPEAASQVELAYLLLAGRAPNAREKTLGVEFLQTQPPREFALALFNLNAFIYVK